MAASQRRYKATLPTEPAWPVQKRARDRSQDRTLRRKAAGRRRRFAMLVVVPVLLMLGSVYSHTVAAGLEQRNERQSLPFHGPYEPTNLALVKQQLSRARRLVIDVTSTAIRRNVGVQ